MTYIEQPVSVDIVKVSAKKMCTATTALMISLCLLI